jgi:hypothetical protein
VDAFVVVRGDPDRDTRRDVHVERRRVEAHVVRQAPGAEAEPVVVALVEDAQCRDRRPLLDHVRGDRLGREPRRQPAAARDDPGGHAPHDAQLEILLEIPHPAADVGDDALCVTFDVGHDGAARAEPELVGPLLVLAVA